MARNKLTQKEAIFYQLYMAFKSTPGEYIPVFKFMGEVHSPELGLWGFVSHECSARSSEMRKENPELVEATTITGKSGAKYFGYRFNPAAKFEMIRDEALQSFYNRLKNAGV